jgi:hypothetical protein
MTREAGVGIGPGMDNRRLRLSMQQRNFFDGRETLRKPCRRTQINFRKTESPNNTNPMRDAPTRIPGKGSIVIKYLR